MKSDEIERMRGLASWKRFEKKFLAETSPSLLYAQGLLTLIFGIARGLFLPDRLKRFCYHLHASLKLGLQRFLREKLFVFPVSSIKF